MNFVSSIIVKAVMLLLLSTHDYRNASANALENIALNKPASLSSEYSPENYSTSGANNGNTDRNMNNPTSNGVQNGIHCNNEVDPWWKVDLEGNKYDF